MCVWRNRVVVVLPMLAAACMRPEPPPPTTTVTVATFEVGGIYNLLGQALGRIYTSKIQGLSMEVRATPGSVFNVDAIQQGKVDVAFTLGDVAYLAYKRGTEAHPQPHDKLRGIAVLYEGAMQIVAREGSGIRSVKDLRGHRVGVGSVGSGTAIAARMVISAYGLREDDLTLEALSSDRVVAGMRAGEVDAGFVVASYPYPIFHGADTSIGVQLVPIERAIVSRLRSQYPFFRPTVIPAGTYPHQKQDIETIGVDTLLVCRSDLDEELVYRLTKTLFDELPDLTRVHSAAATIHPDKAPATPIPLHQGAARYYREREVLQ